MFGGSSRTRTVAAWLLTLLAILLVWFALVAPNRTERLTPAAFVRIPLEGLVLVVLLLVLPAPARRIAAAGVGVVLGLLSVVKLLDMGFYQALGRPFDPVIDWRYAGSTVSLLGDAVGRPAAILAAVATAVLAVALVVLLPLALARLTRILSEHRTTSLRFVAVLGVAWAVLAVTGVRFVGGEPVASTSAAGLTYDHVRQIPAEIKDQRTFAKAVRVDPLRDTPGSDLLTGLRGKDVIVAFVESYGRVAVQGTDLSSPIAAELDAGSTRLTAAGFSSRSAFLTSPTFGAISWLAHSTLQSGLWVDSQQRYDVLVDSDRITLSDAFHRAGWRTVGDVPANYRDWPQGRSFYHYDKVYDSRNVGYAGPKFGYSSMPDQYTLATFRRLELAKRHQPVMAEIDLVSSHAPWAPLPRTVDWSKVGDGSIYDGMPAQAPSPDDVWRDPKQVPAAYGRTIQYSLSTLISFVETSHDNNLVLVVLGDHQPATIVSGEDPGHDVPVTIIAHDPAVMARIASWGWQAGLRPHPDAPVWRMDTFRGRFLAAYGPAPPGVRTPRAVAAAAHR